MKTNNGYKSQDTKTKNLQGQVTKGKDKNKANQTLNGVTPSFTFDRALTYLVGTAVFFAGGYVIYYFVKKGFEGLDKKGEDNKKGSGEMGKPILLYSEKIEVPTTFPIQATNLQFPSYSKDVQILQEMLLRVYGNILPTHGADGKFGYETLSAVKRYLNSSGVVSKADWEGLVKRAMQMSAEATQSKEAVMAKVQVAVMPDTTVKTNTTTSNTTGQKDMRFDADGNRVLYPRHELVEKPVPVYNYDKDFYSREDFASDVLITYALEGLGNTNSGVELF
jgi:peptidoglycan hydrolase-like protein with peptidoglycan-binding domain